MENRHILSHRTIELTGDQCTALRECQVALNRMGKEGLILAQVFPLISEMQVVTLDNEISQKIIGLVWGPSS